MKHVRYIFLFYTLTLLLGCSGKATVKIDSENNVLVNNTLENNSESLSGSGTRNHADVPQKVNFVPPEDKTLLFIGQDSDTIEDYLTQVSEDNIEGVTLYTQIKSADPNKTFFAVERPANWQAGNMDFVKTLSAVGNASLAVGLAFDNCNQTNHEQQIATGTYDDTVEYIVRHFKSFAPRKVYLRIGYEFDGPWNCYTPQNYKLAFQKISKEIDKQQASNITTVWQSATWPDSYGNHNYDLTQTNHLNNWYPGDEYVDWVAMSVFYRDLSQWNYTPPSTPEYGHQSVLDFARKHNKPVMIAEAAPQGYRIGELTHSYIQLNQQTLVTAEQIWNNWYQPFFAFISDNRDVIRAVAYINANWQNQTMWHCKEGIPAGQPGCSQGNWGDSRVQANEYIKQQWLRHVNDSSRWIQTSDF